MCIPFEINILFETIQPCSESFTKTNKPGVASCIRDTLFKSRFERSWIISNPLLFEKVAAACYRHTGGTVALAALTRSSTDQLWQWYIQVSFHNMKYAQKR